MHFVLEDIELSLFRADFEEPIHAFMHQADAEDSGKGAEEARIDLVRLELRDGPLQLGMVTIKYRLVEGLVDLCISLCKLETIELNNFQFKISQSL